MDLTRLENDIEKSNEEVDVQKKALKKLSFKGSDYDTKRKLDLYEKIKKDRKTELLVLIIFFIIGVMFGIYIIYSQFTLNL